MFKKILVPLDGSQLAERALGPALQLAGEGCQVLLVRVPIRAQMFIPAEGGYGLLYPERVEAQAQAEALTYLQEVQAARAAGGQSSVRVKVVEGDVASGVVDVAREENADLIVMSSHGYSGLTRWVLGSVAEKVLHGAPCPVLVIRSPQPISRALVTLDGSPLAAQALEPAVEVAARLGASLTLLRVLAEVDQADLRSLDAYELGLSTRLVEELNANAEAYLTQLVTSHARAGHPIKVEVRAGPAAATILKYVEQHNIDLIGMATHGRSALRRWMYGSVTEKVLRSADCSMLVVRPSPNELR